MKTFCTLSGYHQSLFFLDIQHWISRQNELDYLNTILKETNTTAVMISHDLTDRLLYLEDGRCCDEGETSSLLQLSSVKLAAFLKPWRQQPLYKLDQ